MPELTGYPSDYRQVGMLTVGGAAAVADYTAAAIRIRDEAHGDISLLALSEYEELAPGLTKDGIEVACWEPHSGYADPASATTALAKRASELGAVWRMSTRMRRVILDGQRAVGIETVDGEKLFADSVVLAAGPWTRPLLLDIGVDLPLKGGKHIIPLLATPRAPPQVLPFFSLVDAFIASSR